MLASIKVVVVLPNVSVTIAVGIRPSSPSGKNPDQHPMRRGPALPARSAHRPSSFTSHMPPPTSCQDFVMSGAHEVHAGHPSPIALAARTAPHRRCRDQRVRHLGHSFRRGDVRRAFHAHHVFAGTMLSRVYPCCARIRSLSASKTMADMTSSLTRTGSRFSISTNSAIECCPSPCTDASVRRMA